MSCQKGQSKSVQVVRRLRSKGQFGSAGDMAGLGKTWGRLVDTAQIVEDLVSSRESLRGRLAGLSYKGRDYNEPVTLSSRPWYLSQSVNKVGTPIQLWCLNMTTGDHWILHHPGHIYQKEWKGILENSALDLCRETREEENKRLKLWGRLGF